MSRVVSWFAMGGFVGCVTAAAVLSLLGVSWAVGVSFGLVSLGPVALVAWSMREARLSRREQDDRKIKELEGALSGVAHNVQSLRGEVTTLANSVSSLHGMSASAW